MSASRAPWHLLSLRTLERGVWDGLLSSAEQLAGSAGRAPLLAGRRFGMLFFNSSLRTRTAFEVAAFDLGGHAVYLQVGGGLWTLESRDGVVMDGAAAEHVKEAIPVLAEMVDGLGVRCFAGLQDLAEDARDPVLTAIAAASPVPILNLESAMDHPHQGLADALTVRRRYPGQGVKIALTWAPHKKGLPLAVAHGALSAFAQEGHEIVVAHPPGYDLEPGVLADACRLAEARGGQVRVVEEQAAALEGAQVVYAKSWGSSRHYGNEPASAASLAAHRDWMIDGAAMARTQEAIFMHCLPVRRGLVVADEVLDSDASVVVEQAGARLDVQKATLCHAMGVTVGAGEETS
jgi:N-acetylornithine carbamoyltransferase